jgi:uncharacterized membrane protein YdbT with pleckstrin-like domain
MNEENTFWKGSSSQWLNLWPFAGSILVALGLVVVGLLVVPAFPFAMTALVLPIAYMIWKYLVVRTRVYEITSQRVRVTSGVINQTIDEVELYRVKDTQMFRPWWMRLTGLASILMDTSDRSIPNLVIPAVSGGVKLREILREQVELARDRKRVREMDFEEIGGDPLDNA